MQNSAVATDTSDPVAVTDHLFFGAQSGLEQGKTIKIVDEALSSCDDGELYLEYALSEALVWDDGQLKEASFDTERGFGLRGVLEDRFSYGHSSDMKEHSLKEAAELAQTMKQAQSGNMVAMAMQEKPPAPKKKLYSANDPVAGVAFADKIKLLQDIDSYIRSKDNRIRQVSVSMTGSWKAVQILRAGGDARADIRPLVRLDVSVVLEADGKMESGHDGRGGRQDYTLFLKDDAWKQVADEALRQAVVKLDAVAAPAGEMTVVLGPGWPGVLLHEAVGHGLEGDFNRKGTSAFAGLLGERVAAKGVTVVDDGTLPDRRGSLTIDDEGTPTQRNVLIEDGILVGYMQDRLNAKLMGREPTGNGRRESYEYAPMPRMTNTYMLDGQDEPEDILKSVKNGLYAVNFGGGQVDITSGKFVFEASEAYLIEDGKITAPVKGATLIGSGPEALKRVSMIGNDMKLDAGIGTCGKDGQGVPVGVGQPTMRIDGMTVGGTAA
jgi:TldD protein